MFYLTKEALGNKAQMNVLRRYESAGTVILLNWTVDALALFKKESIWYMGQSAMLQDCLYRTMGFSRYTILNDLDEYFIPTATYKHSWQKVYQFYSIYYVA